MERQGKERSKAGKTASKSKTHSLITLHSHGTRAGGGLGWKEKEDVDGFSMIYGRLPTVKGGFARHDGPCRFRRGLRGFVCIYRLVLSL